MATSFDALLQADRQKRRNEDLANVLLGKGRRASTPSNGIRKPAAGGSLAGRIGAANRSMSATPILRNNLNSVATNGKAKSLLSPNPRPARDNPVAQKVQRDRLKANLATMDWEPNANTHASIRDDGAEISIRGLAGPYTVIGSNFAPGTTAADIRAAMFPIGGEMQDCRIVSKAPTVEAEMVFSEKARADNVIAYFHNMKASLLRAKLLPARHLHAMHLLSQRQRVLISPTRRIITTSNVNNQTRVDAALSQNFRMEDTGLKSRKTGWKWTMTTAVVLIAMIKDILGLEGMNAAFTVMISIVVRVAEAFGSLQSSN
ncbi:MAG: hypothetical protein Q9223_002954 [Gallowayella weberi]